MITRRYLGENKVLWEVKFFTEIRECWTEAVFGAWGAPTVNSLFHPVYDGVMFQKPWLPKEYMRGRRWKKEELTLLMVVSRHNEMKVGGLVIVVMVCPVRVETVRWWARAHHNRCTLWQQTCVVFPRGWDVCIQSALVQSRVQLRVK